LPGDSRMQIGFIAFDSVLYFYGLDPSFPQPKMFIISDMDGTCFSCDETKHFGVLKSYYGSLLGFVAYPLSQTFQ